MAANKGIVLVASINAFHGNVLPENFDRMYQEHLGLEVLGESGLSMTINCHGIDFLMYPWLRDVLNSYANFRVAGGLFSHIIPSLFSREYVKWQHEEGVNMIRPKIPISFYPEFCNPENPQDNFWVLDSQNLYYSLEGEKVDWFNESEIEAKAISFKGKVGLIMKEKAYKPILDAFFLAQRLPDALSSNGRSNLDSLVDTIAALNEVVLWPLDLEATYVGSHLGQEFWRRLVAKIQERGLENLFLDFDEVFPQLAAEAVETKDAPHRNLMKWTSLPATFNLYAQLSQLSRQKLSVRQKYLLSIAGGADIAAAIYQKSSRKASRPAVLLSGEQSTICVSGSKEIIDATYLALESLVKGGSFAGKLSAHKQNKSLFWQRLMAVAVHLEI